MEFARNKQEIFISQRKYVLDLLKETGKLGCKPVLTPLERNWKQNITNDDPLMDRETYQHLVGKLIYLSLTRLNIAFSMSCFQHELNQLINACSHEEAYGCSNSHLEILKKEVQEKDYCSERRVLGM